MNIANEKIHQQNRFIFIFNLVTNETGISNKIVGVFVLEQCTMYIVPYSTCLHTGQHEQNVDGGV